MTDGQGGRGVCEEELSRCEATRRRKARIKSVSSDPGELQDSRGESQLHKVFQLRRDRLCQFYVYRVVWVCARVCVSALGSERFLDPLNGRKKTIWIDDTSCAPLMFRQHRFRPSLETWEAGVSQLPSTRDGSGVSDIRPGLGRKA